MKPTSQGLPKTQPWILAIGLMLLMVIAVRISLFDTRIALLFLVGILLGVTLYHAAFGFTTAYRRMFLHRDVRGVLSQLVMLAAATLLFAPVLASGSILGREVAGAVAPAGIQVIAGAFLFGLGMQLASGCGSGTLYHVGGGSTRTMVALVAFVAGSFWASLHMASWQRMPSLGAVALGEQIGWWGAVAVQLLLFALLAGFLWNWKKIAATGLASPALDRHTLLKGPWPLMLGALALAVLNLLTLLVAGHPWTITWAFTLWGGKAAVLLGWDPATSAFWQGEFQRSALESDVLEDITSVMNIGIIIGALCAAALAGRFSPGFGISLRSLAAAILGGLAMGYGARIAFGCNIGAFFSGIASTSLHGWFWIAAALPGTWLGVQLRPRFGLQNE